MFIDLKKGFQVHCLDTNKIPKYSLGKVIAVSDPRFMDQNKGIYNPMQNRVVDLTVEVDGETKTYTVPEGQNVAKALGITLSTSIEPVMNELAAIKQNSEEIIGSIDFNKERIEACNVIMEEINPAFKQTREQDRRMDKLEGKVDRMEKSFDELKDLLIKKLG